MNHNNVIFQIGDLEHILEKDHQNGLHYYCRILGKILVRVLSHLIPVCDGFGLAPDWSVLFASFFFLSLCSCSLSLFFVSSENAKGYVVTFSIDS